MGMTLSSKTANLMRTFANALFHKRDTPQSERIYAFYLLLRPMLSWLGETLSEYNLEKDEVESELYLFCAELFKRFNPKKSSIIPYLEKHIPWIAGHWVAKLKRNIIPEEPQGLFIESEGTCEIQEQFYWTPENILFEERYIGKSFTVSEKYVIFRILIADKSDLTQAGLARICGLSRKTMINKLKEMSSKLEEIKP
jgi:hypothetical protein